MTEKGSVLRLGQNRFELILAPEKGPSMGPPKQGFSTGGCACLGVAANKSRNSHNSSGHSRAVHTADGKSGCHRWDEFSERLLSRSGNRSPQPIPGKNQAPHVSRQYPTGDSRIPVKAGDDLFGADMGEQSIGMVVNASPSPDGGFDVLAVIQASSVEGRESSLETLDGPCAGDPPLPYSQSHEAGQLYGGCSSSCDRVTAMKWRGWCK